MYATMIVLLAVGGTDIVHGRIEVSTLTGLLSYSTQILSGVMMFASALNFIAMAKPAVDRIGEILSEENTVVKINEQLRVNTAKANAMTNVLGPISNNFGYIQYIFVAFVAALLSTVRNSHAIMVLEHGEIIERGNHEQLIAQKGKYYELYTGKFELD